MWQLAAFNQGAVLGQIPDPAVRRGVCAALCDMWINLMQDARARKPEDRMDSLRATISMTIRRQKSYKEQVREKGRQAGREFLSRGFGMEVEEQTRILRRFTGRTGMVLQMQKDLEVPGARVGWSLLFHGGGAHALAGCNEFTMITTNIMRRTVHLFDPNIGEYVGQPQDVPAIVDDMFRRIPGYNRVETMERRVVTVLGEDGEDDEKTDPFAMPWDKKK
ncbi:MAG: hypothetical protein ACK4PG_06305 [Acetobacteraceae bacterium]